MKDKDISLDLQQQIESAVSLGHRLNIVGGNSKYFLGRYVQDPVEKLKLENHQGIISYEPSEQVLVVRAGTALSDVEKLLRENQQMLPFEPPHFGHKATIGGTISSGLSGPSRPYSGATRDYVLGIKIINGHAEVLSFGGTVMKNVAGYDVSRLLVGAMGTLGTILDISIKVRNLPEEQVTLMLDLDTDKAFAKMGMLARKIYPVSGTCHYENKLYVRLTGSSKAVAAACQKIGGEKIEDSQQFWYDIKEQCHPFFDKIAFQDVAVLGTAPLWRFSLPPATPPLELPGDWLIEWGGAQRWFIPNDTVDMPKLHQIAQEAGGNVSLFRGGNRKIDVYGFLSPSLKTLHQRIKAAFDPYGLFNPGRMYAGL